MKRLIMASLGLAAAWPALAEVKIAAIFTDGAVLQAHRPAPVWGRAEPGEKVTVSYGKQTKTAVADATGAWRVDLDAMDYVRQGQDLTISSTSNLQPLVLRDVLVGEVWLGIGQSNMEYPLDLCKGGKEIAKGGVMPATVRYFHLPKDGDEKPRDLFGVPKGVKWRAYVKGNERENNQSSGLLALFAQRLARELDAPVGVIGAAVGGANLETWMSAEAVAEAGMVEEHGKYMKIVEQWHQNDIRKWENRPESEKNRPFPKVNFESRPQQVFNAMVCPLAPYAVRGIFYYQGEMNSGWELYLKQFPAMTRAVRRAFGAADEPFYIVQLPDYKEKHWVRIRDVQRQMSEALAPSGLVVTIDGDEMELHPRDKDRIADRMARLALADCYGRKLLSRSPAPVEAVTLGDTVEVTFKNVGGGLKLTDGAAPRTFELVETGDTGMPVAATIASRNTVALKIPAGMKPTRVRYGWAPDPDVNLVNAADLPATPFEVSVK